MASGWRRVGSVTCVAALAAIGGRATAVPLDKDGEMKFGVRTYVNARIGTERTHLGVINFNRTTPINSTSATFPYSAAGHLRQNRFFVEAELNHKLDRLVKSGVGPLSLLNDLPFGIRGLGYNVTFRGEYEGIYDWGPREYSTAEQYQEILLLPLVAADQAAPNPYAVRRRLRSLASHRARLFQAYVEGTAGNLFVRFGRQVLSWGETDAFQLLDHINPLDSSFGGFLIPLDERRVPIDMLRAQYRLGEIGPLTEVFVEAYGAIDDRVGFEPGTPAGSPWTLPSFGAGRTETRTFNQGPSRTIEDTRGGVRLFFNAFDATFSLAYLSTYFDTPAGQLFKPDTPNGLPLESFNEGLPCPINPRRPIDGNDPTKNNCGSPVHVVLTAPRTQVFGATTTFAIPQLYSVVRSEAAYFKDEAAYSQYQFDPFLFGLDPIDPSDPISPYKTTGGRRLRDSINLVLGLDSNVRIRFLNPNSTFFVSTQFFYKHIKNAGSSRVFNDSGRPNPDREILPIVDNLLLVDDLIGLPLNLRAEPLFVTQPADSFLHTLAIGTSYFSGQVNPFLAVFYDWGGAFVYQPGVNLLRDPFRFSMNYSILDSHHLKGGSGVSLLRDRDNIEFRFEYVI